LHNKITIQNFAETVKKHEEFTGLQIINLNNPAFSDDGIELFGEKKKRNYTVFISGIQH